MKITVIVPTGEVRCPLEGEYYYIISKIWRRAFCDFKEEKYPIGTSYEVEVPDIATKLVIGYKYPPAYASNCDPEGLYNLARNIPLPHQKKKVKKWNWVLPCISSSKEAFVPAGYYTEEGIKQTYPNRGYYHKVMETEIETDE
jgi:hypothetical protein